MSTYRNKDDKIRSLIEETDRLKSELLVLMTNKAGEKSMQAEAKMKKIRRNMERIKQLRSRN